MALQGTKALATEPEGLSSIPGTRMMEGEKWLYWLSSDLHMHLWPWHPLPLANQGNLKYIFENSYLDSLGYRIIGSISFTYG